MNLDNGTQGVDEEMPRHIATVREVMHLTQFVGLPTNLTNDVDTRKLMPPAELLVIEGTQGNFMLLRYAIDGKFSGDTWHASLDDAIHQANYEFGLIESDWKILPDEIDPIAYAKKGRDNRHTE